MTVLTVASGRSGAGGGVGAGGLGPEGAGPSAQEPPRPRPRPGRASLCSLSLGFPYEKVVQRVLYLQVLDYDRFSRNDPIGEVSIPLNKVDLTQMQTFWKDLKPCSDGSVRPGPGGLVGQVCCGRGADGRPSWGWLPAPSPALSPRGAEGSCSCHSATTPLPTPSS